VYLMPLQNKKLMLNKYLLSYNLTFNTSKDKLKMIGCTKLI
jgi:hypothetical protein